MARPHQPRVRLPIRYALFDNLGKVRALTETIGGAVDAYIKLKFDDEEQAEIADQHRGAMLWHDGWDVQEITKPVLVSTHGRTVLDPLGPPEDAASAPDEFVVWVRPGTQRVPQSTSKDKWAE
jgi:hypothetical protein